MKVFIGTQEIDTIVKTIKVFYEETGSIPEVLVSSYKESLNHTSSALVQRFYQRLADECPQAIKFFV